jgi:hypothetical protein
MGRIEADRWITGEPWSSTTGPKNTIKEDTLRSERRTTLKKDLPEPTLLEMSGKPIVAAGWLASSVSATPTKRRIRSRIQNLPVEEEIRKCGARLRKFRMLIELVWYSGKGVQFTRHVVHPQDL